MSAITSCLHQTLPCARPHVRTQARPPRSTTQCTAGMHTHRGAAIPHHVVKLAFFPSFWEPLRCGRGQAHCFAGVPTLLRLRRGAEERWLPFCGKRSFFLFEKKLELKPLVLPPSRNRNAAEGSRGECSGGDCGSSLPAHACVLSFLRGPVGSGPGTPSAGRRASGVAACDCIDRRSRSCVRAPP